KHPRQARPALAHADRRLGRRAWPDRDARRPVMTDRPAIREGVRSRRPPPTNLPSLRDRLIGREQELVTARARLLRDDVGLLTLTGPGGSGKTRLALQLATEVLDEFDDGAWFVPLASVRDPELIATTICQGLGLHDQGGRSLDGVLRDFLRRKN